ncbi:hypothetical protein CAP36_04965 [Chitinophagaceae bacterium IBVUCB2]|nr:hypothetical protein CAP36_04965 [Chitinophagaceae bacterium IBVUCB2]
MNSSFFIKFSFAFLLLAGMLVSKNSSATPGIGEQKVFVLDKSQFPQSLKKHNPAAIYMLYYGTPFLSKFEGLIFRGDTITNYKKFTDSLGYTQRGFRLIFGSNEKIDSVWQTNNKYVITDKAYNIGEGILRILAYNDTGGIVDEFVFDYLRKYSITERTIAAKMLPILLRQYDVYDQTDRNIYSVKAVWSLSVGIDKYQGNNNLKFDACESDAISYNNFFSNQYSRFLGMNEKVVSYHGYLLTGANATKEAILNALKDISLKASANDYFIFNFSGYSDVFSLDSSNFSTYFFPYDNEGYPKEAIQSKKNLAPETAKKLISLKTLQEYIQLIPARNQLFITEAGPSDKFRPEFIRTLMQSSPLVATLLNKNRIIIVPNKIGQEKRFDDKLKGLINHFITSIDTSINIYNIFSEDIKQDEVTYAIENNKDNRKYFDIFFEKQFLKLYRDIFGDSEDATRGLKTRPKELQQTINDLTAKKYALVVGTDNYNGKGWNKLSNPIKDARAVADELSNSYGFEVQLLEDKPMDSVYKAIREYYRIAQPNDQLVVYFAGHGDVDNELLDDGFIVCADSKSIDDDPVRNSYIPYAKLQKMLNNIPARQVLVLLDVCHGGTFDAKAFDNVKRETNTTSISNKNVLQFLKDKLPLRTRKFLSSVGSEPAFDGKAGRHSPFANLLLQVLRAKGEGSNGIVTLGDINAVLQTASLNETATLKISPHMADFGNTDAFSEFIFIPIKDK